MSNVITPASCVQSKFRSRLRFALVTTVGSPMTAVVPLVAVVLRKSLIVSALLSTCWVEFAAFICNVYSYCVLNIRTVHTVYTVMCKNYNKQMCPRRRSQSANPKRESPTRIPQHGIPPTRVVCIGLREDGRGFDCGTRAN